MRVVGVVEGFDGTGKSTFAKKLAEDCGFEYVPPYGHKPDYYDRCMRELTSKGPPAIFDRFFFSELVFSKLLGRPPAMTEHQREIVESMLIWAQPVVIFFYRDFEDQRRAWIPTEHKYPEVIDRVEEFDYEFRLLEQTFRRHLPTAMIQDFESDVNAVRQQLLNTIFVSRPSYGRGRWNNPLYSIVGEKFAKNNKWLVPFERSASAQMIHTALREAGVDLLDCWFTNAIKTGVALDNGNRELFFNELRLMQPKLVLSFGRTARFLCELIGQPFLHFTHPAYYLRKGRSEDFFREFMEKWRKYAL